MKTTQPRTHDAWRREAAAARSTRRSTFGVAATGHGARLQADEIRSSPRMREQAAQLAGCFGARASNPVQRQAAHLYGWRPDTIAPGATEPVPATPTVQARAYTAAANRHHLNGSVEVTAGAGGVDVAGTLKDAQDQDVDVKGTVDTPEYFVAADRRIAPLPGASRSGWDNYWTPTNALRVRNLTAAPRGMKLGQLMTCEVALEALRRGKSHVIAMSVSDARGPFYTPLGFVDYNASRPWQDLKRQYDDIANYLRSPQAANLPDEAIGPSAQHMADLKEEMSNSSMIIASAALRDNSRADFTQAWQG